MFNVVPEARLNRLDDKTPERLIYDRISPKVAKSTHGPTLMPLNLQDKKAELLEFRDFSLFKKDEELSKTCS